MPELPIRDTQFAGFAKAQWEKVANNIRRPRDFLLDAEALKKEEEQIIAQCAYDLVAHALNSVELPGRAYDLVRNYYDGNINTSGIHDYFKPSELLAEVPDLTTLPEVKENE